MKYILIILLITVPIITSAQNYNVGIELGASIANLKGDVESQFSKYRLGINAGIGVESEINNSSSLKFSILYQQKGQNYDNGTVRDELSLSYLTAPVTYKKYFHDKVAAMGGFYGSFLIKAKIDGSVDAQDSFKRNDAGWILGLSIHPSDDYYIDMKSSWSLVNINSGNNNDRDKIRNHSFELLLGFKI